MEEEDEPVEVREKIYKAAMLVMELTKLSDMPEEYFIPEILRDAARASGENEFTDFWKEVYEFIFTYYVCVGEGTRIVILPDGPEKKGRGAGPAGTASKRGKTRKSQKTGKR